MRALIMATLISVGAVSTLSAQEDESFKKRQKQAETVKAPDTKALLQALIDAARQEKFTVKSSSLDSGVVRAYEEHRHTETVQKGESFTYFSSGCWTGVLGCRVNTVQTKPWIVDERGLVQTWRLITFKPVEDGKYSVLFELYEPDQNGVAEAKKDEREAFYKELKYLLDGQNRGGKESKIEAASAAVTSTEGPAGTYELISINGLPLPAGLNPWGAVTTGTYVLDGNGEFKNFFRTNMGSTNAGGKYTLSGANLMLQHKNFVAASMVMAKMNGDTLSFPLNGQKLVFVKKK